jgi:hypothetical protein
MGVISNGPEHVWLVARWAFRGYLDHVLAEVRDDPALADAVEAAIDFDGLLLDTTDLAIVERLRPVLVHVADEVVSGVRRVHVEGRILDDKSQEQFREAVAELRTMFARWWPAYVPK